MNIFKYHLNLWKNNKQRYYSFINQNIKYLKNGNYHFNLANQILINNKKILIIYKLKSLILLLLIMIILMSILTNLNQNHLNIHMKYYLY